MEAGASVNGPVLIPLTLESDAEAMQSQRALRLG